MKRTLERGLKVLELAERKVNGTSLAAEIDACMLRVLFLGGTCQQLHMINDSSSKISFLLESPLACCSPIICIFF